VGLYGCHSFPIDAFFVVLYSKGLRLIYREKTIKQSQFITFKFKKMKRNEIIEKITEIFREVFGDKNIVINDEMTAADVENWDSLTHMLMITKVEDELGIKFKLKELNRLKKVGDLISIVESKLQ
jgi:acyl carrier protein